MTWCLYQQVQYLNMDTIFHSAPKMFWQKELYKLVSILFLNTFFSPSVNSVAEVMITGTNWAIFFCKSCQKILSWCYCPAIILIHSGFCKVWESLLPPVQYFVLPIQNWGSHFPNVEASVFRCKFNNKQRMTSRYWSRHVASQRWLTLRVTLHLLKQTSLYHFGDVVCKEVVYSPPMMLSIYTTLWIPEVELGLHLLTSQVHPKKDPIFVDQGPEDYECFKIRHSSNQLINNLYLQAWLRCGC